MTAAKRITATPSNGGSDSGAIFFPLLDNEIERLWGVSTEWLTNVAGTNTITATADSAVVSPVLAIARPKAFWLVPVATNTTAVTINIDGTGAIAIVSSAGAPLGSGDLVIGRMHLLVFDGTSFRIAVYGSSSVGAAVLVNGGRVTNTTGVPILGAAQTAKTSILWSPNDTNQISLPDGSGGWTVVSSAEVSVKTTDAQSGATHNGTKVIDGLTDTSQFVVGMKISGTNVGAGSTIATIDSPTQITGTVNSSGSATNTITFKLPADTGYDVFGKLVSGALKLFLVVRSSILNQNTMTKVAGVDVLSADNTLRWLGAFITSATDGQVDWTLNGQRRYRIWNHDNKRTLQNTEGFSGSGTYFGVMGLTHGTADVVGGSGASGAAAANVGTTSFSNGGPGGRGGRALRHYTASDIGAGVSVTIGGAAATSSFGALVAATGGANGTAASVGTPGTPGADGTGSSGDVNISGGGPAGGSTSGIGQDGAGDFNAGTAQAGKSGWALAFEVVEY